MRSYAYLQTLRDATPGMEAIGTHRFSELLFSRFYLI